MSAHQEMEAAAEHAAQAETVYAQGGYTATVIAAYAAMHHLARALVYGHDLPDDERRLQLRRLETLQPRAAYGAAEAALARAQLAAFRGAVEKKLAKPAPGRPRGKRGNRS